MHQLLHSPHYIHHIGGVQSRSSAWKDLVRRTIYRPVATGTVETKIAKIERMIEWCLVCNLGVVLAKTTINFRALNGDHRVDAAAERYIQSRANIGNRMERQLHD